MIDFAQANDALRRASTDEVTDELLEFLGAVADLGRDPALAASPDAKAFLQDTAPLIRPRRVALHEYVATAERIARQEFHGDDWRRLCERRSTIELVRSFYRDLVDVDWDESFMDVSDLDHVMRGKGEEEGFLKPEQIPANTPRSHWWWWAPKPPPDQ